MYLYDYQRTQLRKLGRGGNYIVHGSRQVGITTILLNYALVYISRDPGSVVRIMLSDNHMVEYNKRALIDYIYAAKTTRVSAFGKLDVSDQTTADIKFTNGGVIQLRAATANPISVLPFNVDLLIMDIAIEPTNEIFNTTLEYARDAHQIVIGYTGSMDRGGALYGLYINSLRGLNNYEYIRLPWDVSENLRGREPSMKLLVGANKWDMDAEMVPHI